MLYAVLCVRGGAWCVRGLEGLREAGAARLIAEVQYGDQEPEA